MTRNDSARPEAWNTFEPVIPARPGSYILILPKDEKRAVQIGRLGPFDLRAGYYCYVGSALGTGGLRGRLHHHLHPAVRPHWHIDYLREVMPVEQIWLVESEVRWEHTWAALLRDLAGMCVPIPRFGASDCSCEAHLLFSPDRPVVERFRACLYRQDLAEPPVQCLTVTR